MSWTLSWNLSVMHGLEHDNEDYFLESDVCIELQGLIDTTMTGYEMFSVKEHFHGDSNIPVCSDLDSES